MLRLRRQITVEFYCVLEYQTHCAVIHLLEDVTTR